MGLSNQQYWNRCKARYLLCITAYEDTIKPSTTMRTNDHDITTSGLDLLHYQIRNALSLADDQRCLDSDPILPQAGCSLIKHCLTSGQEPWKYFVDVDFWRFISAAESQFLDHMQKNNHGTIRFC